MQKIAKIFLLLLVLSLLPGQTIIENPARPENPRAGRVVTLEEVSRIKEVEGTFYFRQPNRIYIAPARDVIVADWDQLLQFDSKGTFLRNLFKKGEGPGEMKYLGACLPTKDYFIVHSSFPPKIMWFDYQGKLIKEMRLKVRARFLTLLLFCNSRYYFYQFAWPAGKKETEIIDLPYKLVSISTEGEEFTTLASFRVKTLVARSAGGGGGLVPLAQFLITSLKDRYLCLSHTSEYLIKVFDAQAGKVVRQFRRRYSRVKWDKKKKRPTIYLGPNKKISPPVQKYENDIYYLLSAGEQLWVITSQREKDKGILVDVFDVEGRYLDCFYLKLPQTPEMLYAVFAKMAVAGEYLYSLESEADLPLLKKYRLVNLK